jgi:hypothetical protein
MALAAMVAACALANAGLFLIALFIQWIMEFIGIFPGREVRKRAQP